MKHHLAHVQQWLDQLSPRAKDTDVYRLPGGLRVYVSTSNGWDRVAVHCARAQPTLSQIDHIRKLFFEDDELVQIFMPPKSRYSNPDHNTVILWHATTIQVPTPPVIA